MTYYPGRYRPRHSAVAAVEKRYLDIPSLHQRLAMYFDYWPACSVDFWRVLQDVPVSPALPKKTTGDAGHQPEETT